MMSDTSDPREPIPAPTPTGGLPLAIWGDDLERVAGAPTSWLWDGYLARGNITLLTSQWKSGKTTLLSVLLARRESGGQLAGRAVAAGRTVIVSEESPVLWNERRCKLGFGPSVGLLCRPFAAKPTREEWLALIDRLAELGAARGVDLAVIDALATFLPGRDEANAGAMLDSLLPLQGLTEQGMAVLLLHHPSKGKTLDGQAARGSGALHGMVDISVEMRHLRRASGADRRRVLYGYSRHEETPLNHVIELTADGTDYCSRGELADVEYEAIWEGLRRLFTAAGTALSQREVAGQLAAAGETAGHATLWRWLSQAVARGLLLREGAGTKASPYRYRLPDQDEMR
jgi:AAA domain-containing protein